jgi:hypothetical protein
LHLEPRNHVGRNGGVGAAHVGRCRRRHGARHGSSKCTVRCCALRCMHRPGGVAAAPAAAATAGRLTCVDVVQGGGDGVGGPLLAARAGVLVAGVVVGAGAHAVLQPERLPGITSMLPQRPGQRAEPPAALHVAHWLQRSCGDDRVPQCAHLARPMRMMGRSKRACGRGTRRPSLSPLWSYQHTHMYSPGEKPGREARASRSMLKQVGRELPATDRT